MSPGQFESYNPLDTANSQQPSENASNRPRGCSDCRSSSTHIGGVSDDVPWVRRTNRWFGPAERMPSSTICRSSCAAMRLLLAKSIRLTSPFSSPATKWSSDSQMFVRAPDRTRPNATSRTTTGEDSATSASPPIDPGSGKTDLRRCWTSIPAVSTRTTPALS
jgi:hypothetical protein